MKKPRIQIHGQGTGVPSREDIHQRAKEIAAIRNHDGEPTQSDYRQAQEELTNTFGAPQPGTKEATSRDPSTAVSSLPLRGQPNTPVDENESSTKEVLEGVEEAQHDQMQESRKSES